MAATAMAVYIVSCCCGGGGRGCEVVWCGVAKRMWLLSECGCCETRVVNE